MNRLSIFFMMLVGLSLVGCGAAGGEDGAAVTTKVAEKTPTKGGADGEVTSSTSSNGSKQNDSQDATNAKTPATSKPIGDGVDTTTGNVQNYGVRTGRMVQEYKLTMNLVDTITVRTKQSGKWSNASTWEGGVVPSDGARVLIEKNHTVTINKKLQTHIRTIKVEGELSFNPHRDTALMVDTLLTAPASILRIGEPRIPIDADKTATIVIYDYDNEGMVTDDPSSPDYDPLRIGQGILTNGLFLAHGSEKTPYVAIAGSGVAKGSLRVELDEEPQGWQVGDEVVVLGTSQSGVESERIKIESIEGTTLMLQTPLEYEHRIAKTTIDGVEIKVHVANVSRNIIIKTSSEVLAGLGDKNNPDNVEHRGHVLFMHNNNVNINYVEFLDLGRTNKKYPLDETVFESEKEDAAVTHVGTNQAARYSVHFHRAGLNDKIGHVNDCVVINSPGWGYVNHSSNVDMKENIAYHVYGASFITEAGDELGVFEANMAIETRGVGRSSVSGWKKREGVADGGFQGNGFWIIGPRVDFVDNIVNGSSNAAYALNHHTIDSVNGVIYESDKKERPYGDVGLKSFVGNIAYANSGGVFGILSGTRSKAVDHVNDLLAWNNGPMANSMDEHAQKELISWWYPNDVVLNNITLINDIENPQYTGIGTQTKLRKTVLQNIKLEGLEVGLRIPEYVGLNIVKNAYLNNLTNMLYGAGTTNHGANTRIEGDIVYGTLPNKQKQTNIRFELMVRDVSWKNYQDRQYNAFNIVYAPNGAKRAMKLYMSNEQSPEYKVLYGVHKGKTNQQLIDEGHKPVGGELVPDDAVVMKHMSNVSGVAVAQ